MPQPVQTSIANKSKIFYLALVMSLMGQPTFGSGYYNLGAFKKKCSSISTPAFVQAADSGNVPSGSSPQAVMTQTAGNTLVAMVYSETLSTATISDTLGSSWHLILTQQNSVTGQACFDAAGGGAVSLWYATGISAGSNTITVSLTPNTGSQNWFQVVEYSGVSTSNPLASWSSNAAIATTSITAKMSSGNVNVPSTPNVVYAAFSDEPGCYTPTPVTAGFSANFTGNCYNDLIMSSVTQAAGPLNPKGSQNNGDRCWIGVAAVFNGACH